MSNPPRTVARRRIWPTKQSREDPLIEVFSPCDVGTRLLEEFARIRPADYTFLEPKDFSDLHSSAFAGIAERDSFAKHVLCCTRCGEV